MATLLHFLYILAKYFFFELRWWALVNRELTVDVFKHYVSEPCHSMEGLPESRPDCPRHGIFQCLSGDEFISRHLQMSVGCIHRLLQVQHP